jgi:hypothetical protein
MGPPLGILQPECGSPGPFHTDPVLEPPTALHLVPEAWGYLREVYRWAQPSRHIQVPG